MVHPTTAAPAESLPGSRPNIVYLHSHDTGRCTQPYGYPVNMPAFQQLAETGVTFRNAFSAAPTCSPSRAALLTGMAPHSAGMLGLAHRGFELRDQKQHLASFLRSNGYCTVLAGHQHLTRGDPHELGYEVVIPSGAGQASVVAPNAARFLKEIDPDVDRPFFLDVGFDETHRPFHEAPAESGRYIGLLPGLPDTPDVREDMARFHSSLRELDWAVGFVLDALDESGLAATTIVIVTTDHGPPFPGMKATLTDAGIGVGLLLRVPGKTSIGTVCDALVSQIDLFPTLCELAGLEPPVHLQGVSLCPLLDGTSTGVRSEIFAESTFHAAYEPHRAIRTDRWTYIRRFGDRHLPVLPNIDASPALDWNLAHGWAERAVPMVQLFDNALDPLQRVNLAGISEFLTIEGELDARLSNWMIDTGDPLVNGPVALPPGAFVNRSSARSPDDELVQSDFR